MHDTTTHDSPPLDTATHDSPPLDTATLDTPATPATPPTPPGSPGSPGSPRRNSPRRVSRRQQVPSPRPDGSGLHRRLCLEWHHLRRQPAALAHTHSWHVTVLPYDDLDDLLTLAGYDVAASAPADEVLRRLVELARVDPLAARIVLQRLLPGLLAQTRTRGRRSRRSDDVFEELVGAAWITVREFDPRRRPSCLAAALLAGAEYRAFGRDERARSTAPRPLDALSFDEHPDDTPPSSLEELADLVRDTLDDGATDEDMAVVRGLVRTGGPQRLAAELGVTTRTVRNRRDRITERMRQVALAA